jgi:hypothetical protein
LRAIQAMATAAPSSTAKTIATMVMPAWPSLPASHCWIVAAASMIGSSVVAPARTADLSAGDLPAVVSADAPSLPIFRPDPWAGLGHRAFVK